MQLSPILEGLRKVEGVALMSSVISFLSLVLALKNDKLIAVPSLSFPLAQSGRRRMAPNPRGRNSLVRSLQRDRRSPIPPRLRRSLWHTLFTNRHFRLRSRLGRRTSSCGRRRTRTEKGTKRIAGMASGFDGQWREDGVGDQRGQESGGCRVWKSDGGSGE